MLEVEIPQITDNAVEEYSNVYQPSKVVLRRVIGNREDLTILYRKARDIIWENRLFDVFNLFISEDQKFFQLTIMNLWRICKSNDEYWLEEYDLSNKNWNRILIEDIGEFPCLNVYPIVNDIGYINGVVQKATNKLVRYLNFKDIKELSGENSLSKSSFISIIQKYLRKTIGKDNLAIKAKLLRSSFYANFYDSEVVRFLMSVDYQYVGFFQYIRCLVYKEHFLRVAKERKNLLPIFLKINMAYWNREDIFSKKIWCKQGKKSKLCDQKKFSSMEGKRFRSFDSLSNFRWLLNQKTTVIKAWNEHRLVDIDVIKMSIEAATKPPCTFAIVALMKNLPRNQNIFSDYKKEMVILFKIFLNESNAIWEKLGYKELRKWITLNNHRMMSFYDYLLDEGLSNNILNKKTTWASVSSKSDEWHERKAKEREAQMLLIKMNQEKLEWDSLINDCEINRISFSAIISYTRLYQESVDMHHCVIDYLENCLHGNYRVFHVEDEQSNRATLGIYLGRSNPKSRINNWFIDQVQSECNEMTTKAIYNACEILVANYNKIWISEKDLKATIS